MAIDECTIGCIDEVSMQSPDTLNHLNRLGFRGLGFREPTKP